MQCDLDIYNDKLIVKPTFLDVPPLSAEPLARYADEGQLLY